MIRWLMRQFGTVSPDPALLDHVPVNKSDHAPGRERQVALGHGMSHQQKLELAAARATKAFACAADGIPHEVERQVGVRIVRIDDIDAAWDAALQEGAERGLLDSLHAPSRNVAPITRKGR
jgi:hypothetical protein